MKALFENGKLNLTHDKTGVDILPDTLHLVKDATMLSLYNRLEAILQSTSSNIGVSRIAMFRVEDSIVSLETEYGSLSYIHDACLVNLHFEDRIRSQSIISQLFLCLEDCLRVTTND